MCDVDVDDVERWLELLGLDRDDVVSLASMVDKDAPLPTQAEKLIRLGFVSLEVYPVPNPAVVSGPNRKVQGTFLITGRGGELLLQIEPVLAQLRERAAGSSGGSSKR